MTKLNCKLVKAKRKALGWTLTHVAFQLGISKDRLKHLENGDLNPYESELEGFQKLFGLKELPFIWSMPSKRLNNAQEPL